MIQFTNRSSRRAALVFAAVALVAGCSTTDKGPESQPEPSGYSPPARFDHLTTRWATENGVDLFTPQATAARAFVESRHITETSGNPADGYPGFIDATTPDTIRTDPTAQQNMAQGEYGTMYLQLLGMNPTATGYTATVRRFDYWVEDRGNGTYFNHAGTWLVYEMDLTNPIPSIPNVTPASVSGPRRAPLTDQFGNWKITRYQFVPGGIHNREAKSHIPPEAAQWPGIADTSSSGQYVDKPIYPTLEPTPGWPDAPAT